jgi:hypothetical protein
MQKFIRGTFHFHSTYSHDGRSTLEEIAGGLHSRGFSFCVMTEHFEDLDAVSLDRYVRETKEVSLKSGVLLIPGVEVHLDGLDTILFPVRAYDEVGRFISGGRDSQPRIVKVLAHPVRYRFDAVVRHLEKYHIDGIELWNQQADGGHMPPLWFFELLKTAPWRNQYQYFFGCDLHNVNLTVDNFLVIPAMTRRTPEAIVDVLAAGDFVSRNGPTGIEYRNGSARTDFDNWLTTVRRGSYYRGRILRSVRRALRSFYKLLPRDTQHSLNDFKNSVRNKV